MSLSNEIRRTGSARADDPSGSEGVAVADRPLVERTALVRDLVRSRRPVVTLFAPAGYGKSTLLEQWGEKDPRPFARMILDRRHDDPEALLADVAEALRDADPSRFPGLPVASPMSLWSGVRRTVGLLRAMGPVLLVLDDVHEVTARDSLDVITTIARSVPDGTTLAISARTEPPIELARARGRGQTRDLRRRELAFGRDDAASLFRAHEADISDDALDDLVARTEGWPVALYLSAVWAKAHRSWDGLGIPAANPRVAGFLRHEFLSHQPRRHVSFLVRTSVLDRLSAPLCDAVLGARDSARILGSLERSNLLVVRDDARGRWYRYHALFREMLRAELDERAPDTVTELLDRAARWCEENGEPEGSISYAREIGDVERVARLAAAHSQRFFLRGRETTVRAWFDWLRDHADVEAYVPAGILGVIADALAGRSDRAERWAELVERANVDGGAPDGSTSVDPWLALMRAVLARGGLEQARIDAGLAYGTIAIDSPLRPMAHLLVGLAHLAAGDCDDAATAFEDAVSQAERVGAVGTSLVGLSELAAIALTDGNDRLASELAERAAHHRDESGLSDYPIAALSYAVTARGALHQADLPRARSELARAHRLRPGLTRAFPLFAVQTLLELTSVHASLADAAGALTILRDVELLTQERPDLGVYPQQAVALRAKVDAIRVGAPGAMSLTTAELELLPALSSHLTFREIAERRAVSPHTVKTQASSIYRKLRVTSRGDAISRAAALGLLDELGPAGSLPRI